MRIPPDDVDPDSYLRRYTSSKMQLLKATLALVSNRKIVSPPTGPDELYRWTLMNAILFLYDMFPFHRKFFEVMDQEDWNQIFKHFWVLAKVIWYHKYKRWLCREAFNDKPKQLTIKVSEQTQSFLTLGPQRSLTASAKHAPLAPLIKRLLTSPLIGFRTFAVPHHTLLHAHWCSL